MGRRLRLESHLELEELERRYRAAKEPHKRSWWQILWLLAKGQTAVAVAESTGYSLYWIGQLVRRYNELGPTATRNRQYTHSHRPSLSLSPLAVRGIGRRHSGTSARRRRVGGTDRRRLDS